MTINERISKLRQLMKENGISIYIVPTSDYHQSEYVSDYFKAREFMTGFTGSAGTAVFTLDEAVLWTDGRYFIQADKELQGSEVKLYRQGMEGVPDVEEYISGQVKAGDSIGFYGRVMSAQAGMFYAELAEEKGAAVVSDKDLVGLIWRDRPQFPKSNTFVLEEKYAGVCVSEKIKNVRKYLSDKIQKNMLKQKSELLQNNNYCNFAHVLNDACDIAWLLNIRGGDIPHVPVILSYLYLDMDNCVWYVRDGVLEGENVKEYLEENHVIVKEYNEIYEDLEKLQNKNILADFRKINYHMYAAASMRNKVIDGRNPEETMKSVKNSTEIENIRKAHIKDGVVVTKFMCWLKKNIGERKITELDAASYIDNLRREQEGFVDLSFDTIAAYGENAAMMHYEPSEKHNAVLGQKGFLLVDSGGHYMEGSTDITRTYTLGELTEEEKRMYTAVVRSNMILANAKFLYGCDGRNLDVLAREPLWQMNVDYRCGTGHGNGYLLNVHEGPNAFRWRKLSGAFEQPAFEEGMITTDEPGVYKEDQYGIRIENELLCKKGVKNEYGQFMEFEIITYAPIDLEAILPEDMTRQERDMLNKYHKMVYKIIAPFLEEEERECLRVWTREI